MAVTQERELEGPLSGVIKLFLVSLGQLDVGDQRKCANDREEKGDSIGVGNLPVWEGATGRDRGMLLFSSRGQRGRWEGQRGYSWPITL